MKELLLTQKDAQFIIKALDSKTHTQKELAKMFNVSQPTISRYNSVVRLRLDHNLRSELLAKRNLEILKLKKENNIDLTDELVVPDSFVSRMIDIEGESIECYFTTDHLDCMVYIRSHPEYKLYTVVEQKRKERYFMRSKASTGIFGYVLILEDYGYITGKDQKKVFITEK